MHVSAPRIGVIEIELHIPASNSLKAKRSVIKSLKDRLRQTFNLAVAETDHLDKWQRSTLTAVTVSTDMLYIESLFEKIRRFVDSEIAGRAFITRLESQIY
jgi:uncharacterized protein YlxP (DUF503 family)